MTLLKAKRSLLLDGLNFFSDQAVQVGFDGAIHMADVRSFLISSGLKIAEVEIIFNLLK